MKAFGHADHLRPARQIHADRDISPSIRPSCFCAPAVAPPTWFITLKIQATAWPG